MGIIADFSEWQGTVDWGKVGASVKAGKIDGVILRVQSGYSHPDTKYKEYVQGCKINGIPFGTYAYFKAVSVSDAQVEADSAFKLTDPASECFAVDIEVQSCKNAADLIPAGQAYIDRLKSHGMQHVGLYSGLGFFNNWKLNQLKYDWSWIASYGANDGQQHTDPNVNEDLWQFTSVAKLDGVSTNLDESVTRNGNGFGFFVHAIAQPAATNPPLGVITMGANSVIRTDATTNSPVNANANGGATKAGDNWQVWAIKNDWYNIGNDAWVYKDQISFTWSNIAIGGFNQFEIDAAFTLVQKAFPQWHIEKKQN